MTTKYEELKEDMNELIQVYAEQLVRAAHRKIMERTATERGMQLYDHMTDNFYPPISEEVKASWLRQFQKYWDGELRFKHLLEDCPVGADELWNRFSFFFNESDLDEAIADVRAWKAILARDSISDDEYCEKYCENNCDECENP
jgi:hypothetical protein